MSQAMVVELSHAPSCIKESYAGQASVCNAEDWKNIIKLLVKIIACLIRRKMSVINSIVGSELVAVPIVTEVFFSAVVCIN